MRPLLRVLRPLRGTAIAISFALAAASVLLICLGENPKVLFEALRGTLFTPFGLGYALFYATPLLFTGLAVAIPFQCGLFNIGAEGQLHLGAIAVVAVAAWFPSLPWPVAIPLGIVAAAAAGGAWGGFAGFLKARRGSHEVIVTILLNFIAIGLVNYLILYVFKDPANQAPETLPIPSGWKLPKLGETALFPFFQSTPVNGSLVFAVGLAFLADAFLFRSRVGYEFRAVGQNPLAARFGGISVGSSTTLSLTLGGALAGLVGINEVMGYHHSLIEGFSPGYGFTGIAVALLARNRPLAILWTAFLFGALQNSARELEFLSDKVSKELSLVLQGGIVAITACDAYLEGHFAKLRSKKGVQK